MILKGEMSMLNVIHLQVIDVDKICKELKMKRDGSPQFFMRIPIVLDCAELDFSSAEKLLLNFSALKVGLLDLGFTPIGVRNTPDEMKSLLLESGWLVMPANTKASSSTTSNATKRSLQGEEEQSQGAKIIPTSIIESEKTKAEDPSAQTESTEKQSTLTIDRPVRSGQQIYAADGDLTVLAATSAGSEVMADGSIHVYGALRGRVLAGVNGNQSARIFCSSLQAELIVIAGRYQLLDESNTTLIGKPAMIRLDGEKLIIEPLSS